MCPFVGRYVEVLLSGGALLRSSLCDGLRLVDEDATDSVRRRDEVEASVFLRSLDDVFFLLPKPNIIGIERKAYGCYVVLRKLHRKWRVLVEIF